VLPEMAHDSQGVEESGRWGEWETGRNDGEMGRWGDGETPKTRVSHSAWHTLAFGKYLQAAALSDLHPFVGADCWEYRASV
jgi:hypothetical protein